MTRLADGERAAFDEVYDAMWSPARAFGLRLRGHPDGEDLAQSSLMKIFEESHRYRRGADPLPWLFALIAWEARTLRRRQERRREDAAVVEPGVESCSSEVERRQLIDAALEVLGALDEEDREIIGRALDDERRSPLSAASRKRRQRSFARLRAAFWRSHG